MPTELIYPRYCGVSGMSGIAKVLAGELNCRLQARVVKLTQRDRLWCVELEQLPSVLTQHVLLTCPVPQALALLPESLGSAFSELKAISYSPCLALLAVYPEALSLPAPGAVRLHTRELSFLADNQAKGISTLPALTLHSTAAFAEEQRESDSAAVVKALLKAVEPWCKQTPLATYLHRWRYATPTCDARAVPFASNQNMIVAGDAFAGGRVEGAFRSGVAAARRLLES